jgi:hypothetical protein
LSTAAALKYLGGQRPPPRSTAARSPVPASASASKHGGGCDEAYHVVGARARPIGTDWRWEDQGGDEIGGGETRGTPAWAPACGARARQGRLAAASMGGGEAVPGSLGRCLWGIFDAESDS